MDERSLATLEFPKILSRLAEHTAFAASREMALALRPTDDIDEARLRQRQTAEAQALLAASPGVGIGGARDVRPLLPRALRSEILMPGEMLDIRMTLESARRLRHSLERTADEYPLLAAMAARIEPCTHVINEIGRCLSERGDVLDTASEALARIRAQLRIAHDRLLNSLERLVTNPTYQPYLQEPIVTQRNGRYVIPLKTEFRGRIPGLVHDQSASGATLFIEPLATVELNNAWRELQLDEEREVRRILAQLTELIAEEAPYIARTVEALAELDLAFAKAKYAQTLRAVSPELLPFRPREEHPGSVIELRRARHPLLNPATVVPIDVHLGTVAARSGADREQHGRSDDYFVLVITGPNTGGKTVSLKTVGLLACMAQAGLAIPADEGSRLTVFGGIYADIGDEQSIEQSLSTFSSHMTHIIEILRQADARSLVLLDELGAGTDPEEGSALARALLAHLVERRITTLATTHYSELKVFAHVTPGVRNASVEFDLETLSPTYELTIGLPGRSNALAIARRLGLPEAIIAEAASMLDPQMVQAEGLLADIKAAREATQKAEAEAEALRRELAARLAEIEEERRRVLNRAREEAQAELEAARQEIARARRRLTDAQERQAVAEAEAQLARRAEAIELLESAVQPVYVPSGPLHVGDRVWVPSLQASGEVKALEGEEAEVQLGSIRVRVPQDRLELRERPASAKPPEPMGQPSGGYSILDAPAVRMEFDLRGMRVEEALAELDKYLDAAFRANLPWVRIIHGKGTGILRQAVRERLAAHPLVTAFRSGDADEGSEGVTIVQFSR